MKIVLTTLVVLALKRFKVLDSCHFRRKTKSTVHKQTPRPDWARFSLPVVRFSLVGSDQRFGSVRFGRRREPRPGRFHVFRRVSSNYLTSYLTVARRALSLREIYGERRRHAVPMGHGVPDAVLRTDVRVPSTKERGVVHPFWPAEFQAPTAGLAAPLN